MLFANFRVDLSLWKAITSLMSLAERLKSCRDLTHISIKNKYKKIFAALYQLIIHYY